MKVRKVIYADKGKVLTNGETYGTEIFLADGLNEKDFYEISQEEYDKMLEAKSEV